LVATRRGRRFVAGAATAGQLSIAACQLRQQPGEHAAGRSGQVEDGCRADVPDECPYHLQDRRVRQQAGGDRHAAADQHPTGGLGGEEFADQPGLADAGLTGHEDDGGLTAVGTRVGGAEPAQFVGSADHDRAGQILAHVAL
jgi:hypothetical protein